MNLRFNLKATVVSRSEVSRYLRDPGDAVIVDRQGPRWLVLACPCGCGSEVSANLDPRAGPAWRLYRRNGQLSLYPSIWRDSDCEAHFVILRDKILMVGSWDDEWLDDDFENEESLDEQILVHLSGDRDQSCEEISASIAGSVPWDILRGCRKLARKGLAIEGRGKRAGRFRKVER